MTAAWTRSFTHSLARILLTWALVVSIIAVYGFVASFNSGLGPCTWVYSSEIWPIHLRAQGSGVAVAVNRLMNATISMTFISIYTAITIGGTFFLFCGLAVIAWVFFYYLCPETKGKSLEEIQMLFTKEKKNAAASPEKMTAVKTTKNC